MQSRFAQFLAIAALGAAMAVSGCKSESGAEPGPSETAQATGQATDASDDLTGIAASETALDDIGPGDQPSGWVSGDESLVSTALDLGALEERRDPERLLRFYTHAIRIGDWVNAAKAWSLDSTVTPEKLRAEFDGVAGPRLAVGRGDSSKYAGSLFYVTPVTVDFPDARTSRRGTIVMERADDAPGASPLQLVWRIKRSTITP